MRHDSPDIYMYMIVNGKRIDVSPVMKIENHTMKQVTKTKYVGDIFNQRGNNDDMVEERVRKGRGR